MTRFWFRSIVFILREGIKNPPGAAGFVSTGTHDPLADRVYQQRHRAAAEGVSVHQSQACEETCARLSVAAQVAAAKFGSVAIVSIALNF